MIIVKIETIISYFLTSNSHIMSAYTNKQNWKNAKSRSFKSRMSPKDIKKRQEESLHKCGLCRKVLIKYMLDSPNYTREMKSNIYRSLKSEYDKLRCYGETCYNSHNIEGESKNHVFIKNLDFSKVNWLEIFYDLCDKITKHHHLFENFCSNKRITPEENEYLIEASKRFGNYNMKKMMAKLPSKDNPETFFELLTNWRLVYGRLSKFGKKSSNSRRLLSGIKCSREVDEILWAIFEHRTMFYSSTIN